MMSNKARGNIVPPPVFGVEKGTAEKPLSTNEVFDSFNFPADRTQNISLDPNESDNASVDYGEEDYSDDGNDADVCSDQKKRKRNRPNITEEQRIDRRERNKEHAKRSRVRKKFVLDSLQQSVNAVEEENAKLQQALREHLPDEAEGIIASCIESERSVLAKDSNAASRTLDDPDYSLVKALQTAQQNFVITDPSLPDNPIVYASQGFLNLTGYELDQVLGRNCRFLQGPRTDQKTVDKIRRGIEEKEDTTVVLLNYRADGSTFWNQFFIAALRDGDGNVVNYLGVQCKVSKDYAAAFLQHEALEESKK